MDKYTRPIAVIAILVFSVAGFVIVKAIVHYIITMPRNVVVYLDTRHMQELSNKDLDSAGITLIGSYLCNKTNKKDTSTLWADAFVYATDCRGHYSKPDTIVILDTAVMKNLPEDIEDYGFNPDDTIERNIPRCRIVIPSNKIVSFRNYKYKYKDLWLLEE
jgi:hypothetical protein